MPELRETKGVTTAESDKMNQIYELVCQLLDDADTEDCYTDEENEFLDEAQNLRETYQRLLYEEEV